MYELFTTRIRSVLEGNGEGNVFSLFVCPQAGRGYPWSRLGLEAIPQDRTRKYLPPPTGPGVPLQWRNQDFPEEGALTPKEGAPTYYLANFSQKLHENDEILSRGARPWRPLRTIHFPLCRGWYASCGHREELSCFI